MLTALKQRTRREDDKGFTLIELMVVVLIIAILLAIAIPTFLGARNTANARSAQSNLRNALTAEQTQWTNSQGFSATAATMQGIESALNWVTAAPAASKDVSVAIGDLDTSSNAQAVVLEAISKDGNCYFIEQSNDPSGSFTGYAVVAQSATHTCPAPTAPGTLTAPAAGAPVAPAAGSAGGNVGATGTNPVYYTTF